MNDYLYSDEFYQLSDKEHSQLFMLVLGHLKAKQGFSGDYVKVTEILDFIEREAKKEVF